MRRCGTTGCGAAPCRSSLGSIAVYPTRPAEQLDGPEEAASPFRTAFGRARIEAFTATGPTCESPQDGGERAEFEYLLLKRRGKRSAEESAWNEFGREGWELVGVTDRHAAFKRPL